MQIEFRVIPNANRTPITGVHDGKFVLRVNAPVLDGRANRTASQYLAKRFGVAKSRVRLVSGEKSRHKKIEIVGLNAGQQEALLARLLDDNS
jgi:uncharacterized protein (TIGR00251 family)